MNREGTGPRALIDRGLGGFGQMEILSAAIPALISAGGQYMASKEASKGASLQAAAAGQASKANVKAAQLLAASQAAAAESKGKTWKLALWIGGGVVLAVGALWFLSRMRRRRNPSHRRRT